jgi:uncharacterized alpha-E superfamily protein
MNKQNASMLSRVAENLYWMSRYLERAENTARMLDVYVNRALELAPGAALHQARLRRLADSLDLPVSDALEGDLLIHSLSFDPGYEGSILFNLSIARENARHVREQLSSEMWTEINRLYLDVRRKDKVAVWESEPHEFYMAVKEGAHLFQGVTDATMNHNQGWHFIQIGRYTERLTSLLTFLSAQLPDHIEGRASSDQPGEGYFELVAMLKSVSAFEAFCKVYNPDVQPDRIAEFLLFNPEFPRSARFCIDTVFESLNALADATMRPKTLRVNRLAGRLQSSFSFDEIDEVLRSGLTPYLYGIKHQAYQIHDSLFDTYISYSVEAALT